MKDAPKCLDTWNVPAASLFDSPTSPPAQVLKDETVLYDVTERLRAVSSAVDYHVRCTERQVAVAKRAHVLVLGSFCFFLAKCIPSWDLCGRSVRKCTAESY